MYLLTYIDVSVQRSTSAVAAGIVELFEVIIRLGPPRAVQNICKKILRRKMKTIYSNLSSFSPRLIRATLYLLTTIVRHSESCMSANVLPALMRLQAQDLLVSYFIGSTLI